MRDRQSRWVCPATVPDSDNFQNLDCYKYGYTVQIKERRYEECINVVSDGMVAYGKSVAGLSLLAFSYYQAELYINAAECYEELTQLCPSVDRYPIYYAQSLVGANLLEEAMKASSQCDNINSQEQVIKLQSAIKFYQNDIIGSEGLIRRYVQTDPDAFANRGCIYYTQGKWNEALKMFVTATKMEGYRTDIAYNICVCRYRLQDCKTAEEEVFNIIQKTKIEHPELSCCDDTSTTAIAQSIENKSTLKETRIVEAMNLLAAIYYINPDRARKASEFLRRLPPRSETDLDPVTLHNQALMNMGTHTTDGFEKLEFLIKQEQYPPETFANLVLLYVEHEYYDRAADLLADNDHLKIKYLTPFLCDFLEAVIDRPLAPDEAYSKLETMAQTLRESLKIGCPVMMKVKIQTIVCN